MTTLENSKPATEAILAKLVANLETNSCFENTYTETHVFVWDSGRYETRYLAKVNEYTCRVGKIHLTDKERGLIASQITKHLVFCL